MGKASSSKKVARAAGTGGGRTSRGRTPWMYYGIIALVVILGIRGDLHQPPSSPRDHRRGRHHQPADGRDHLERGLRDLRVHQLRRASSSRRSPTGTIPHGIFTPTNGVIEVSPTERFGGGQERHARQVHRRRAHDPQRRRAEGPRAARTSATATTAAASPVGSRSRCSAARPTSTGITSTVDPGPRAVPGQHPADHRLHAQGRHHSASRRRRASPTWPQPRRPAAAATSTTAAPPPRRPRRPRRRRCRRPRRAPPRRRPRRRRRRPATTPTTAAK